jgi:hypothetical protein
VRFFFFLFTLSTHCRKLVGSWMMTNFQLIFDNVL